MGISIFLNEVRAEKTSLTDDSLEGCADRAHDKSRDFDKLLVDLGARDKELYAYLFNRFNRRMKATVAGT